MTNAYKNLMELHEKQREDIPSFFPYTNRDIEEGMAKLGLSVTDTDKVLDTRTYGCIRKSDSKTLSNLLTKQFREIQDEIKNDTTGDGFIYDMFLYELGNHEYKTTRDAKPAIEAAGFSFEEIEECKILSNAFLKARMKIVG